MAWSMHAGHRYDEARSRWLRPPPVEEGQVAHVDAPTATALLGAQGSQGSTDR